MFSSLQAKLIVAFVAVLMVAFVLAGAAFIYMRRDDQEQQKLDHVAASAPEVLGEYAGYVRRTRPDETGATLDAFVKDSANRHAVRIMLIDNNNRVTSDSGSSLIGKVLTLPDDIVHPTAPPTRGYVTWQPEDGATGEGLVLVSSSLPTFQFPAARAGLAGSDGRLVLAVPQSTIANAWLSLLPGLGVAALIALPVAILLAVLLAQYITRPIKQLTLASQQMAAGTFDVVVPTGRKDEMGELAEAFAAMAERVGGAHMQMRALVANVSHDLKTPLTSILGFARALHTGAAPANDVERIGGIIEEEAGRLSTRLNDLLLLSELDSGKAMVTLDEVDVAALARAVTERVLPPGGERTVRLDLPPDGPVYAMADPAKLERAIENLVDNARKFTPPGGTIAVCAQPAPNGSVAIEVANDCDEISDEEVPKLFERFYRRDRTRSARTPGSGLGLSIARDLVRLQNGELEAEAHGDRLLFRVILHAAPDA